jgi:hypothetical protein
LADIEGAIMAPIVIIIMAVMDYVAWQVIPQVAGGNAFWYLAALGLVNVAMIAGILRAAVAG